MAKVQLITERKWNQHAIPHVAPASSIGSVDLAIPPKSIRRQSARSGSWGQSISAFLLLGIALLTGCAAIPDVRHKPTYHNPFPQISRVAVLPFRNQSEEPTLSGFRVSQAYYNELQSIPGFEVIPLGVVEGQLADFERQILRRPIATTRDFQEFAQFLGVDAVLQGAVTDYSPYYPPRMTLKVNWYAANEGFHPIPVGYGLPWGTKKEKDIPSWIKLESERALAKEQIATQTPIPDSDSPTSVSSNLPSQSHVARKPALAASPSNSNQAEPIDQLASQQKSIPENRLRRAPALSNNSASVTIAADVQFASHEQASNHEIADNPEVVIAIPSATRPADLEATVRQSPISNQPLHRSNEATFASESESTFVTEDGMPSDWPDPRGFVPARPSASRPPYQPQHEPIISHMKAYNGNDEDFTNALQEYFYFRDDARFGGWQSYLQRSEDFIRFCCHLHVVETLGSRGGQLESRLNLRWPTYRYER